MPSEYRHIGDQVTQFGDGNVGIVKNGPAHDTHQSGRNPSQSTARAADAADNPVDVCLIIPKGEEFDYARDVLCFGDPVGEGGGYHSHPFSVRGSSVTGIAVVLFEMGIASSAVAATSVLARHDISVLALVGIAGALSPELRLGDVVIASSIEEYMYGAKATPNTAGDGVEFDLGSTSWQAAPEIVGYANNFRYLPGTGSGFTSWRERSRQRRDLALSPAIPELAGDYPDYFVGAIATGEIVSASASFAHRVRKANRFRVAIEMEAGGAARAIYRYDRARLIVIRGISDFSDERKKKLDSTPSCSGATGTWRRYAMHNAIDLFSVLLADPRFPWPR